MWVWVWVWVRLQVEVGCGFVRSFVHRAGASGCVGVLVWVIHSAHEEISAYEDSAHDVGHPFCSCCGSSVLLMKKILLMKFLLMTWVIHSAHGLFHHAHGLIHPCSWVKDMLVWVWVRLQVEAGCGFVRLCRCRCALPLLASTYASLALHAQVPVYVPCM